MIQFDPKEEEEEEKLAKDMCSKFIIGVLLILSSFLIIGCLYLHYGS